MSAQRSEGARRTTGVAEAIEMIMARVARGAAETVALEDAVGRVLWARAALGADGLTVHPLNDQNTATLRSASAANALIDMPADVASCGVGDEVRVHLLSGWPVVPARGRHVFAVVGGRHAGKTTPIERLIPLLLRRGCTVAVVKHHVHMRAADASSGPADRPGTDTDRAAASGVFMTVLAGPGGVVLRRRQEGEPPLHQGLALVGAADLVLVEGHGRSVLPKILIYDSRGLGDRALPDGPFVAVVGTPAPVGPAVPCFPWTALDQLAELLLGADVRWHSPLVSASPIRSATRLLHPASHRRSAICPGRRPPIALG